MDKRVKLFTILAGIFLTALLLAETTGGKLIQVAFADDLIFTLTMGVIPFPVTFCDRHVNEYYGRRDPVYYILGMRPFALILPNRDGYPRRRHITCAARGVQHRVWRPTRIIVGSHGVSDRQFVDISVSTGFDAGPEWLPGSGATGSTVVSAIDPFVVLFIAFAVVCDDFRIGMTNYIYKFVVAVGYLLLYLVHAGDRYPATNSISMAEAHPDRRRINHNLNPAMAFKPAVFAIAVLSPAAYQYALHGGCAYLHSAECHLLIMSSSVHLF
jgi:hypothetical protein